MNRFLYYLNYWFNAIEDHSLHAPFVYELYRNIIKTEYPDYRFETIETLRKELLSNEEVITIKDLGAGSSANESLERTVSDITKHSTSPAKLSRLLNRLIKNAEAEKILELGTSVGINTLYLAVSRDHVNVTTFEGCPETAAIARNTFQKYKIDNINLIEGNLEKTLNEHLAFSGKFDFAYLDANHRYESTMRYFNMLLKKTHDDTIIVIGDIHWSPEMHKAWQEIRGSQMVTLSIDVFEAGICFFMPDMVKQDYILEF